MSFILSSGSTVDLPFDYVEERGIEIVHSHYTIDGVEYVDDMGRDPNSLKRFYEKMDAGFMPTTSLVNKEALLGHFDRLLQKGDVLHLSFSSGMSGTAPNALAAGKEMQEKYPERKIIVIDTLCASSGLGLIVDYAADMRDEGKSIDEVADWVRENYLRVNHQFFTSNMNQFKRTGRVNGPAAMVATVLGICPLLHVDGAGKIIAYSKVRSKRKAIAETVNEIVRLADGGENYNGKLFISNSEVPEDVEEEIKLLEERMPNVKGKIRVFNIGTLIASHTGRGTVATFFLGEKRKID